jgi:alpha-ribazole phosphatase
MNIFIVRHGQTFTNLEKIVCGQYDTNMTELGHKQVFESSKKIININFDFLYTSPLIRAKETASYYSDIENFIEINELMEMNTGDYSSLKVDELWKLEPKLKYQGRYQFKKYPNGESLSILYKRISNWFNHEILNTWEIDDNILIIGHEATVVCAIHNFLQIPLENYPSFKIANAGIVKIVCDLDENQFRVEFL